MSVVPYRLNTHSGQIIVLTTHAGLLTLEEMIQAPITGYLELRPYAYSRAALFSNDDALDNAFHVPLFHHI
jgi:hypothetical protein